MAKHSSTHTPRSGWRDSGRWRDRWDYTWNNSTHPALTSMRQLSDAVATLRPTVTVSHSTGGTLTLAYAGLPDGLVHALPYLEQRRARVDSQTSEHRTSRVSRNGLNHGHAAREADILVIGCTARQAHALPSYRSLLLPMRCHLVVNTSAGFHEITTHLSRKTRQQFTRERARRDWRLEIAQTDEDFDYFYTTMHLPTMDTRHGQFRRTLTKETAYAGVYRMGALFFLTEAGQRTAGMLCRLDANERRLTMRLAGIRDGTIDLYRSGVSMGMYLLILEWAATHGIDTVNLSGFEPFLSKGIFQFKRKMHPEVIVPADHFHTKRLWLHARRDTDTVRDFLVDNPPLSIEDDGTLTAVYFHDSHRPPRSDLQWRTTGIANTRSVDLDAFLTSTDTEHSHAQEAKD